MKKISFLVLILFVCSGLSAQVEPTQNEASLFVKNKVKSISSFYFSSTDTTKTEGKMILEKELDSQGKNTKKYLLSLWEAVSYSNSTAFKYNEINQLVEETTLQTILNLEKRDEDYITSFGDTPLNKKIAYDYNSIGQLIKKRIYTFNTNQLSGSSEPSQEISYEYDSELLIAEKSSSPNTDVFNHNFTIQYQYDTLDNLVKKTMSYGANMDKKRSTEFTFDNENLLIEEKIVDTGVPRNNGHFKYEYDETGHLKNKLSFDEEVSEFVVDVSYEYDEYGNKISGDKEVEFTYYENGLINSELWKDEITDQIFFFVSYYTYY